MKQLKIFIACMSSMCLANQNLQKKELITELNTIGVIKHGTFTLRSGATSSIYIDLRTIISFPKVLTELSKMVEPALQACIFDVVCPVPYGAIPFATSLSLLYNKPMIMCRKEVKTYGTGKRIEGVYPHNCTCLLIEDVVTTGESCLQTIQILELEGLIVNDIIALVDRQAGGKENLAQHGYTLHALFTLEELKEQA